MAACPGQGLGQPLYQERPVQFSLGSFVHFLQIYYTQKLHFAGSETVNMRTQLFFISAIIVLAAVFAGCGGTGPANSKETNTVKENSNNPLETTKSAEEPTVNNAPTLTPVFKAYCAAKIKGDEAALRKIYSQGTLKSFEEQMKEDKIKSLLKFLETEKVTDKLCEIRNEKITGDKAVANIRYDSYPNGLDVVFVKEDGEWKMTNISPTFDSVKSTAPNSNSAK